jgi:hypothetical protein
MVRRGAAMGRSTGRTRAATAAASRSAALRARVLAANLVSHPSDHQCPQSEQAHGDCRPGEAVVSEHDNHQQGHQEGHNSKIVGSSKATSVEENKGNQNKQHQKTKSTHDEVAAVKITHAAVSSSHTRRSPGRQHQSDNKEQAHYYSTRTSFDPFNTTAVEFIKDVFLAVGKSQPKDNNYNNKGNQQVGPQIMSRHKTASIHHRRSQSTHHSRSSGVGSSNFCHLFNYLGSGRGTHGARISRRGSTQTDHLLG